MIPKTILEAEKAIQDPSKAVLYRAKGDNSIFILNPFGGGQSRTGEHKLVSNWQVTIDRLPQMRIVSI